MARAKKDGQYINCYAEREIVEKLEHYCEETGLTKTVAIERILRGFFETHYGLDEKNVQKTIGKGYN